MDTWKKDGLDMESFGKWISRYVETKDVAIMKEIAQSACFRLFLKGRLIISAINLENPVYPEHDNFFITEDNAFIIEFDKSFQCDKELKFLFKILYAELELK